MTEERIKEWLETHEPTVDDTMQLLAEAREEGIEEVLQFFEEGEEDTMWRPYEITDAIECLKEKGR